VVGEASRGRVTAPPPSPMSSAHARTMVDTCAHGARTCPTTSVKDAGDPEEPPPSSSSARSRGLEPWRNRVLPPP